MTELSLELIAVSADALRCLSSDRPEFERLLGVSIPNQWPHAELVEALEVLADGSTPQAPLFYAIVDRGRTASNAGGVLVGDIGFHGPPDEHGDLEIGYAVVEAERGRGIARWALTHMLPIARRREGVRGIVARCESDNAPSIRVLEAAGFAAMAGPAPMLHWRLVQGSDTSHGM